MQRLALRIITGFVTFVIGLLASLVGAGFTSSTPTPARMDVQTQRERYVEVHHEGRGCTSSRQRR